MKKSAQLVCHESFLVPSLDRYPMSHAPFLAALDERRVMVIWFAGSREWAKDVRLLSCIYHADIGKWESIGEFVTDIGYSLGNSVLQRDHLGRLHLWYVRTKGYWQEGEVVHLTWRDLKAGHEKKTVLPLAPGWLARGRPVLRGEVAYLPVYHESENVSAVWEENLTTGEGKLFEPVGAKGGLIHPVLVEMGSNEFRCFMRNPQHPKQIHFAYSMNRGESWSRAFPTTLPNPNSGLDALMLGGNRIVCAYNDSQRNRYPLSLAVSRNGGVEWEKTGNLEDLPGEYSYPSLLLTGKGLFLAYTYKRESIKFVSLDMEQM